MPVRSRRVWVLSLAAVTTLAVGVTVAVSSSSGSAGPGAAPAADAAGGSAAPSGASAGTAVGTSGAAAAGRSRTATGSAPAAVAKTIAYAGRRFQIPAGWQVVDLSADPTACVRFDQHAVYLGTPSPDERCPAGGAGRPAGAMLISAAPPSTGTSLTQNATSHSITATASGVTVEASYGNDPSQVLQILGSANMAVGPGATPTASAAPSTPAPSSPTPSPSGSVARAATATTAATTFNFTGLGFDACAAPSSAAMQAWSASPFRTVGVYIGGSDRSCPQPNLTAAWVAQQAAAGWHFLPLYVGPQVAFSGEITNPQAQAVQSADDAATQAAALGFASGSVLYYDLEAYPTTGSAAAVAFMSAWTQEIHSKGYLSGIYSSENSGIHDLIANHGTITEPDVIDVANWNGQADSDPGADPDNYWPGRRVHQFLGGSNDSPTYGGVTINIDQDYANLVATQCDMLVVAGSPSPLTTASPMGKAFTSGGSGTTSSCVAAAK